MKDFAGNEIDVPAVLKAIASIDWSRTTMGVTSGEEANQIGHHAATA
jgi:hypothetical protein